MSNQDLSTSATAMCGDDADSVNEETWNRIMDAVGSFIDSQLEAYWPKKSGQRHRLKLMLAHLRRNKALQWSSLAGEKEYWQEITEPTFRQYKSTLLQSIREVLSDPSTNFEFQLPKRNALETHGLGLHHRSRPTAKPSVGGSETYLPKPQDFSPQLLPSIEQSNGVERPCGCSRRRLNASSKGPADATESSDLWYVFVNVGHKRFNACVDRIRRFLHGASELEHSTLWSLLGSRELVIRLRSQPSHMQHVLKRLHEDLKHDLAAGRANQPAFMPIRVEQELLLGGKDPSPHRNVEPADVQEFKDKLCVKFFVEVVLTDQRPEARKPFKDWLINTLQKHGDIVDVVCISEAAVEPFHRNLMNAVIELQVPCCRLARLSEISISLASEPNDWSFAKETFMVYEFTDLSKEGMPSISAL